MPRSVLLVIADDWSPVAGCYGDPVVRTPHIDRFAEGATLFERAFCTTPSCAASRASILTGLHSHTHGQYGHSHAYHGFRTHEWVRSLPGVLGDGGVATGLLGKSHVLPRSVYPFNVWAEADSGSAAKLAAKADGFFKRVKDMPFYLQVGSAFPHRKGGARFPAEFGGEEFGDTRYEPDEVPVPAWLPDVPEVRADLAEYYGYVERWDRTVGAMLEALEASGRAGETMVIVMTDHGMPFPAAKGSSFEAGHHCPLLIRVPGGEGVRKEAMVSWLDIAPTVYEWLGVDPLNTPGDAGGEVPRESWEVMPGRSLLPILSQGDPEGWDEVYYAHNFHEVANYYPYRVVRGRRYKYVRNLAWELPMPIPGDLYLSPTWGAVRERGLTMMGERAVERVLHHDREALFDLESDPLELHNRIEDAALADVAEGMRERLTSMRIGTRDPWLRQSFQEGEVTAEQREEAGV